MNKLTQQEIVQETINFYNINNRSIDRSGSMCVYKGENGNICAFARLVKPECRNLLKEATTANTILQNLGHEILLEQYRGHPRQFYTFLQSLHDNHRFWDEQGLNPKGKDFIKQHLMDKK